MYSERSYLHVHAMSNLGECLEQEGRVVPCRVLPFVRFVLPRVPKGEVMFGLRY